MPYLERRGITRLVIVFSSFVVKIPNFTCEHSHFLSGCRANWDERHLWKMAKGGEWEEKIIPSLYCSWFGLLQVQKRAQILNRHLTEEEVIYFSDVTTDIKYQNFGYYRNKLVCVDYA